MPKKMNLTPLYEVMKLTTLWVGVSEKDGDVWGKLEARRRVEGEFKRMEYEDGD